MPQPFHLVQHVPDPERHDSAAQRRALAARKLPPGLRSFQEGAKRFQLDPSLATAINMSLALGAPLLLTGEPGTGKTQVAYFLGWYFGIAVYEFQVKSTSTARDLKHSFDDVAYLRSAYDQKEKHERREFLTKGPLWRAYEDPQPAVVLIDEIDKAPRDFPNDLLQELDKHVFADPLDVNQKIAASTDRPPLVLVTSNAERRLPDAFLRRCIYHHIELTEELVQRIVRARGGDYPDLAPGLAEKAVARFFELRAKNLRKKPSTAELLAWLSILSARGTRAEELDGPLARLPALHALLKDLEDRQLA